MNLFAKRAPARGRRVDRLFSTWSRRAAWLSALIAVAALGSIFHSAERSYEASLAAVHETLAEERAVRAVLSSVNDAETAQRGFILTRDAAFLAPYAKATQALPSDLALLARLIEKQPEERRGARELQELAQAKMAELTETISLCNNDKCDQARAIVSGGGGRHVLDALGAEAQRLLERASSRLVQRERAADAGKRRIYVVFVCAWCFFVLLAAVGIGSAMRGMAEARKARELLARSEKELRAVADNATDLVRIFGEDAKRTLYVSPSCQHLLGFTREEIQAMPARALLHESESAEWARLLQRLRDGARAIAPFAHRLRTKQGTYRWFESSYCLVRDAATGSARFHFTSRDITDRRAVEAALGRQTMRLESILLSMGEGLVVLDENRELLFVNALAREYFVQGIGEKVPREWAPVQRAFLPDGVTPFPSDRGPLTRALRGEAANEELVTYDRAGVARVLTVNARPIRDGEAAFGCVAVCRDITEQRRIERELQENAQRLRVLSEASFEGIALSKNAVIVDTNDNFAAWLGYQPEEILGVSGLELFAPEERERVLQASNEAQVCYEATMLRRDGTRFPAEVRSRFMTLHGQAIRIAVIRDISERREREAEVKAHAEQLRSMSLRDELTGLYNRRGFIEHAEQLVRSAARSKRAAVVFFADLDGMKAINDTFGHATGDRAIIAAAAALVAVFRGSDIVARLGGDEFAIFAPDCGGDDIHAVRRRLQDAVQRANGRAEPFTLSISIGASAFQPNAPQQLDTLMAAADQQMYEEKRRARAATQLAALATRRAAN